MQRKTERLFNFFFFFSEIGGGKNHIPSCKMSLAFANFYEIFTSLHKCVSLSENWTLVQNPTKIWKPRKDFIDKAKECQKNK